MANAREWQKGFRLLTAQCSAVGVAMFLSTFSILMSLKQAQCSPHGKQGKEGSK